jgi:hypothetical protein
VCVGVSEQSSTFMIKPATEQHRQRLIKTHEQWKSDQTKRGEIIKQTIWLERYEFSKEQTADGPSPVLTMFQEHLESVRAKGITQSVNSLNKWFWHVSDGKGITASSLFEYCVSETARRSW